jgi:hypothetical protein
MNFTLNVTRKSAGGIFGTLTSDDVWKCVCLQHAYELPDGSYSAKVAPGTYTCELRYSTKLNRMVYGLLDVPPFQGIPVTDIEIHIGNTNADSEGCILLGQAIVGDAITNSKDTFEEFMDHLNGANITLNIT